MRKLAIVGSGPAGFYTAEAAFKAFGESVRVDIIDRLPTPYGLIRSGVAPDHQSIKAVSRRYEAVAIDNRARFIGNVTVGQDVTLDELLDCYDDVVLATGAPSDRQLGIPGDQLPGVIGSARFVGWYNGHPDHADLRPPLDGKSACVIGNGNVAIDCARILAKTVDELRQSDIVNHALESLSQSRIEAVHIIGRRGPHQASFTLKETGELGELARAHPLVRAGDFPPAEADQSLDSGQRRVVELLRRFAAMPADDRPFTISFDFFRRPLRILGRDRVEGVEVMKTTLDEAGNVVDTGETEVIAADLLITAIGYRSVAIPGAPFDEAAGRYRNEDGLIAPRLWCVGWARRGPTGTIGTNRPDGFALIEKIALEPREDGTARPQLDSLLRERGVSVTSFDDWRQIDAAEVSRAREGAPREKFINLSSMRGAIDA